MKRYLDRDPAITFVVSGSSSLLLESESSESLAGRLDMIRLSPPDFRDYLTINGLERPAEFQIDPALRTDIPMFHVPKHNKLSQKEVLLLPDP